MSVSIFVSSGPTASHFVPGMVSESAIEPADYTTLGCGKRLTVRCDGVSVLRDIDVDGLS